IEQLLNADPRIREKIGGNKVRVINAGVAGHVIQNNLMRYLAKLRMYKPDLVLSLDGANEVHTVARPLEDWNYFTQGPHYEVVAGIMDMSNEGLLNFLTLWLKRNTYLFTWLSGPGILFENTGFTFHAMDPTPEMMERLKSNIKQVADVHSIYHKTLETDGVPHVLALQPMFRNCKKKRTPMEVQIERACVSEKLGFFYAAPTYDMIVEQIKKRGKEAGQDVLDLTAIFDGVNTWVWTDWCHLTNGANYILAKALVNEVKTKVFGLDLLPDDPLKPPLDSYFTDYARKAKVLIDGKPTNEGLRILEGYPGKELLEPATKKGGEPPSVVLDLGKVVPVSRLRIVWGDKDSVPKSWRMEFSEDGKDWKSRLDVTKTQTDAFDQWPGMEYYSDKDTPARYVRYTPTGDARAKPIRLRQISLFR
ncbi:discoidin domain-containing protein, partial [Thermodesulfobacteriota bacterium]